MKKLFFLLIVTLLVSHVYSQTKEWNLRQTNWLIGIKSEYKLEQDYSGKMFSKFLITDAKSLKEKAVTQKESKKEISPTMTKNEEPPGWVVFILVIFLVIVIFVAGALMTVTSESFGY